LGLLKKKGRQNWLGHVERMAEDNTMQMIKRWKLMSKRPIGRPKTLWEDNKERECMQLEEISKE
jgi:hypothetical protein